MRLTGTFLCYFKNMIRKRGSKYVLISKSTGKVLGTHPSKGAAARQERAIQASKHSKSHDATISKVLKKVK